MAKKKAAKKAAKRTSKSLKNKILKSGQIEWAKATWFQPENLKKQTEAQKEKLKRSLINNGFASPFMVWQKGGKTFILDGHHREKALQELKAEGHAIPEKLPALFIDAKNEKEAKKLVLAYSSHYSEFGRDGLGDFIIDIDLGEALADFQFYDLNFDFTLKDSAKLSGPQVNGLTPVEKLEKYLNRGFLEIKLHYSEPDYYKLVEALDALRGESDATFSDIIFGLVVGKR